MSLPNGQTLSGPLKSLTLRPGVWPTGWDAPQTPGIVFEIPEFILSPCEDPDTIIERFQEEICVPGIVVSRPQQANGQDCTIEASSAGGMNGETIVIRVEGCNFGTIGAEIDDFEPLYPPGTHPNDPLNLDPLCERVKDELHVGECITNGTGWSIDQDCIWDHDFNMWAILSFGECSSSPGELEYKLIPKMPFALCDNTGVGLRSDGGEVILDSGEVVSVWLTGVEEANAYQLAYRIDEEDDECIWLPGENHSTWSMFNDYRHTDPNDFHEMVFPELPIQEVQP